MDFDDFVNEIRRCGPVWEADRIAALESQLADRDAEIERLRADLVWAVEHIDLTSKGTCYAELWLVIDAVRSIPTDGTPESICQAVREARNGG